MKKSCVKKMYANLCCDAQLENWLTLSIIMLKIPNHIAKECAVDIPLTV